MAYEDRTSRFHYGKAVVPRGALALARAVQRALRKRKALRDQQRKAELARER